MDDFVTWKNMAFLTDLYQLTMCAAYFEEGRDERASFELFIRDMPPRRSYLVAAGLESVLDYLEHARFPPEALEYLQAKRLFTEQFLEYLARFRFTGTLHAIPEGTLVFPNEPLLRVTAPIIEAQLAETYLLNAVNFPTMVASKAARIVYAAEGKQVVDFSLRRTHGTDAGMKVARASYLAGCAGTSNVLAGMKYRIPIYGTMAHSYIMFHEREQDAFEAYARVFPGSTILLIDTYDTVEGARRSVPVAKALELQGKQLHGVRLDSGDLAALSRAVRALLDQNGLEYVQIMASGNLDEFKIEQLRAQGAPIDSFGVGTAMGTSQDAPVVNVNYKLVEVEGPAGEYRPVMKLSAGKITLPGPKQVYRVLKKGEYAYDLIALSTEELEKMEEPATTLLAQYMVRGRVLRRESLETIRNRVAENLLRLPARYKKLTPAKYPVKISPLLAALSQELTTAYTPGA
ncbi:MAG TPA: nicotinate phosphoribosyltransferase [Methanomicrobia archaeon]|nr:nicotinate phosphoribosyltransferase [Methanomicrobia archaeon]